MNDSHTRQVTASQTYKMGSTVTEKRNVFKITPIGPKFHRCNQSYEYGELDYGAKCNCKVLYFFLISFLEKIYYTVKHDIFSIWLEIVSALFFRHFSSPGMIK